MSATSPIRPALTTVATVGPIIQGASWLRIRGAPSSSPSSRRPASTGFVTSVRTRVFDIESVGSVMGAPLSSACPTIVIRLAVKSTLRLFQPRSG
jgi:hypothetical protein